MILIIIIIIIIIIITTITIIVIIIIKKIIIIMFVCLCDFEESYFCSSMGCEGNTEKLKLVHAEYPTRSFYLFKRESGRVVLLSV